MVYHSNGVNGTVRFSFVERFIATFTDAFFVTMLLFDFIVLITTNFPGTINSVLLIKFLRTLAFFLVC